MVAEQITDVSTEHTTQEHITPTEPYDDTFDWWDISDGRLLLTQGNWISSKSNRFSDLITKDESDLLYNSAIDEIQADRGGNEGIVLLSMVRSVQGFRNSAKAPKHRLCAAMADGFSEPERAQELLTKLWFQAHSDILDRVQSTMAFYQPSAVELTDGIMPPDLIPSVISTITRQGASSEENITLTTKLHWYTMVITNSIQGLRRIEAYEDIARDIRNGIVEDMGDLARIPSIAVNWDEIQVTLSDGARILCEAKKREVAAVAEAAKQVSETIRRHDNLLPYFGTRSVPWFPISFLMTTSPSALTETAGDLDAILSEIAGLQEPAPNIEAERHRREALTVAENMAIPILTRMDGLVDQAKQRLAKEEPDSDDYEEAPDEILSDAARTEIEALRARVATMDQEIESEQNDRDEVEREMGDIVKQADLKTDFWKSRFLSVQSTQTEGTEAAEPEVRSMSEAVDLITTHFGDKITFALNSNSEVKNNYYWRPGEIYSALHWLATDFSDARRNGGSGPVLYDSLMERCGWFYKGRQAEVTAQKYPEWYQTNFDGRTIDLQKHIGKGKKLSNSRIIRIAFEFDAKTQKVVVGYIGRHQRSRVS